MWIMWIIWITLGSLLSSLAWADGGISFDRNRLVFPEGQKSINLTVLNSGDRPYLLQARVSSGRENKLKAPFQVTPPLFRLDGKGEHIMRIMFTGAALPRDRESIFYFSATAIGGQSESPNVSSRGNKTPLETVEKESAPTVSMATETVLKLFYRPKGLPVKIDQSHQMVKFVQKGKEVIMKNPTPYYQSLAYLSFDGKLQDLAPEVSMVAPMKELKFFFGEKVQKVTWSVMTDYGGTTEQMTQSVIMQ